ncbi:MAG: hypothetical protein AAF479_12320 [Pseudomonadota bacterium]
MTFDRPVPLKSTSIVAMITISLAGCGGGGEGGGGGGSTGITATSAPTPTNGQFALGNPVNGVSQLSGSSARISLTGTRTTDRTRARGTYTHNTQALTLNDGFVAFSDQDSPVGGTRYEDSNGLVDTIVNVRTSQFDFVMPYIQGYASGGQGFIAYDAVGIAIDPANVPSTGTASYSGVAFGQIDSNLQTTPQTQIITGTSTVNADFGAGLVDVSMGITATNGVNGAPNTALIDTVCVDNMAISGNTFSRGKLTTSLGGVAVNVTGTGTATSAGGQFYSASGSAPDEVGGSVVSQGSEGALAVAFMAD